jgi:hypothetical protein
MTGTGHYYLEAERLLEHAAAMAAQNVASDDLPELLGRQRLAVDMAAAHATLAAAAVAGLSAHMDPSDTREWRRVAGTPIGS